MKLKLLALVVALSVSPIGVGCQYTAGGNRTIKDTQSNGTDTQSGDVISVALPKIVVKVSGQVHSSGTTYQFGQNVLPGSGLSERIGIEIRNMGEGDLTVNSVKLLDTNVDGSPKNGFVKIDWKTADPNAMFEKGITLTPNGTVLSWELVYAPESLDNNGFTLEITSNDSAAPVQLLEFRQDACINSLVVHPGNAVYTNASPSQPETKVFKIYNFGTCNTTIQGVDFASPTSVFTLKRDFPDGSVLKPSTDINDANADYLEFKVTYQSTTGCGTDSVFVQVKSDVPGANKAGVQLSTQCEACCFSVSYETQNKNYLDFTTVTNGSKTITVNIQNQCESAFKVIQGGINFVGDTSFEDPQNPQAPHYTYDICLPGSGPGQEVCDLAGKTVSIAEFQSMDVKVTYNASSVAGVDASLNVRYQCGGVHEFEIPARGGKPKPCYDFAPGSGSKPNVMQFIGAPGTDTTRNFVIYNCGEADLSITSMTLEDEFYEPPSKNWTLKKAFTGPEVIPAGGLKVYELLMKPADQKTSYQKIGGVLRIKYLGIDGAPFDATAVDLEGHINVAPEVTSPQAVISVFSSADPKVGANLVLSGSGSIAGSEGLSDAGGFLWYLLAKPAGSKLIINGSPAHSVLTVVPDEPGQYIFGLQVHSGSGLFLYSNEATIVVDVSP